MSNRTQERGNAGSAGASEATLLAVLAAIIAESAAQATAANQTSGGQKTQIVESPGGVSAAVKAASTAALATDPSFVVQLSPNGALNLSIAAHDAAAPANVLMSGGFASTAAPTAVTIGDSVREWRSLNGSPIVQLVGADNVQLFPNVITPADAVTNATQLSAVLARLQGFNGATWDRLQVDTNKRLLVADLAPLYEDGIMGRALVQMRFRFTRITTATTTVVETTAGFFGGFVVNKGIATNVTTIYDNTSAAAPIIGAPTLGAALLSDPPYGSGQQYGIKLATGLTVVTTQAVDITVLSLNSTGT